MAIKPTLKKEGLGPVQEFIGTAYDVVKKVHDNLDAILALDLDAVAIEKAEFTLIKEQLLVVEQNIESMNLDVNTTYNTFITRANQVDLSLADFDKTFLGTKVSDPTLNNSSEPLVEGNFYFNSTDNSLRFYTGSAWISPQTIAINAMNAAVVKADVATSQAAAATFHAADALASKNQAETYATTAQNSATAAASSESLALQYRNTIQALIDDTELLVQNAQTSATTAQTYASDAANSAASASISEQEAEAHSLSAGSSASAAATSELNAKNSETAVATHETNAGQFAQAASAAETAATIAANAAESSEIAAALSEANALMSANNASSSEASAAQIQSTVETLLDQFGDQYLGAKTADPTTDNDGNPLVTGAFYLNTTDNVLKFYADGLWIEPDGVAVDAANSAQASADAAALSATSAQNYATSAQNSAASASSSEADAALSATQAETSADNAAASELAAASSATNASDSASASQTSADNASTSADNASTSETNAATSATSASTSANTAITAKDGAIAAENKAEKWAEELTDIEVEPGKYSSKHHAEKSAESAVASAVSASEALASENAAASSAGSASTSETNAASSAASASTSANNAATSETNALSYKNQAQTSASAAATSASNADLSEDAAATSATNAANSAADADADRVAAESAKNAAQSSATTATTKASEASTSANNAATSESNAAGSASAASTSASEALASENKAEQWATELEDVEVEPGKYSSFHHAQKAEDSAFAANASEIAAETSETNAATSATNAATSETNAASSATSASQSASTATAAKNAAQLAESGAQASEGNAATSATQAASSANAASTSENNAAVSESNANTSAVNALASENKAEAWAETGEDIEVEAGKYSALHHANKSALSATSASNSASTATTQAGLATTAKNDAVTAKNAAEAAETTATTKAGEASASATAASTSETNAANSASAASTSETNAANSETAASGYETDALAHKNAAQASETKAGQWAEQAEDVEVETGKFSALHHAAKADDSSTQAATSATNASNSESAANAAKNAAETAKTGAETAETNAQSHATSASNSATAAGTSETNAATSETNAANSATQSANSASAAQTAETNAGNYASAAQAARDQTLAAFDSFDDRYLGQKAVEPTVDNDDNPLIAGALYFDSTSGQMRVFDGSQWLNAYASLEGALLATSNLADLNDVNIAKQNLGLDQVNNVSAVNLRKRSTHTGTQAISTVTGLQTALDGKAPTSHNHAIADVTNLQTTLDGKSDDGHGHVIGDVTGLQTALNGKVGTTGYNKTNWDAAHSWGDHGLEGYLKSVSWSQVTGKPTTFTPSAHTHSVGEVTGLQTELDGKAPTSHTHSIANVTGLQTALDDKSELGHIHAISEVTGLQSALDGKAASSHTHSIANVTGLQSALNAKLPSSSYTAADVLAKVKTVDGSGSGLDADLLDGVQGASFVRSDVNDTVTGVTKYNHASGGNIIFENSTSQGFVFLPVGAQLRQNSNGIAGAIKISLPFTSITDMISFWVDIYNYSTGKSISLYIGGYVYQGANEWINCTAIQLSDDPTINHTVRFGSDANGPCLWIGETNYTWYYPQVTLRDLMVGYSADVDQYANGFNISLVTSFDAVDEILVNTKVAAKAADKLTTARTISLSGGATGNITFDGASNVTIPVSLNETDPTVPSHVKSITTTEKGNWNTAFGWGNHATEGYLKTVSWAGVTGKPTTFTPSAHTHAISNVTGLQTALDGKSDTGHAHAFSELTAVPATATRWPAWTEVTAKPSTFTPSAHTHTSANISDFTEATQDVVGGMVSTNTESGISVTYDDTNGKLNFDVNDPTITLTGDVSGSATMTNLGNVSISVAVADDSHAHTIANVDGLQTALNGKAASSHTHTIANVSGLQTALNGKSATGHGHTIADITSLQTTLDGKAASSHGHVWGDITGTPTTATRWPTWTEVTSKPTSFTPSAHTHAIGNITGLQAALDGKIASTEKGSANGVATLDSTGKVPNSQLPSFVDDVLEYADLASFPTTGETGKIYVALDTGSVYRWSGTVYIQINDSVSSADQAAKLATARTISLGGDASGSASFDGSSNVTISVAVKDDSHNHTIANVDGLQTALNGKAASSHSHAISNITGLQTALDGKASSSHNHAWADITSGVPATASRWPTWSEVTSKPSTFAPSSHGHVVGDISGLGSLATISTNASTSNYLRGDGTWATPPNTNTTYSVISTAEIDAGTATNSRVISAARLKYITDQLAPSAHTHTIANVTGLQTALDGKSATSHNHTLNSLSNVTITSNASGEILKWNGTAWVNNTLAEAGIAASSHNHSWSNITSGVPATATRWPTWSEVTSKPSTFTPSSHGHSVGDISGLGSLATINTNASTTNYLRGDGTWVKPPNTTYSVISTGEIDAGTATAARTINAARIKYITDKLAPVSHNHTISNITGLQTALNGKAPNSHTHSLADITDSNSIISNVGVELYQTQTDAGMSSQWIEPLCSTRLENGIPFAYWGSCDGTTGEQKVHRCNMSSGKLETKVVLDLYNPDDHNAPAVFLHPDGDIIISGAGHNDSQNLHYGVFEKWSDVTTLPNQFALPGSLGITYAQIVRLGKRLFIFTRVGVLNWSYIASDDKFTTIVGNTSYSFMNHTEQCYMLIRDNANYVTNEDTAFRVLRIFACGNGSTMTDRTLRRMTLVYQEDTNEFRYETTQGIFVTGDAGDAGGFNFSDMITMWTAPAGKRFRLWDGFVNEGPHCLITEYDEDAPYGNAKNYLLYRNDDADCTKHEVPVPVGDSIPFKTYFPGMCFPRPKSPYQVSVDSCEIYVSTNNGYNGTWEIKRCVYDRLEDEWDVRTVVRKDALTEGRPKCVVGAFGGLADVMYSLVREYNTRAPAPAYENYNGNSELLAGTSRANKFSTNFHKREDVDNLQEVYANLPIALSTAAGTLIYKVFTHSKVFVDELFDGESVTLMLNTGTKTVTWPPITWVGGVAPTLESTGYNVITLWKVAGVLYGSYVGVV